jgi:hypothetical protein
MGQTVGEVSEHLDSAIGAITASLDGDNDLQEQFAAIDAFVRAVIESKRRLEELQQPDRGADAGTGH